MCGIFTYVLLAMIIALTGTAAVLSIWIAIQIIADAIRHFRENEREKEAIRLRQETTSLEQKLTLFGLMLAIDMLDSLMEKTNAKNKQQSNFFKNYW